MFHELPADLLAFLREGRELEYDVGASEVGALTLKEESELFRSTVTTFPGCDSIIEDPYEDLEDGEYQIAVYDLVAETEDYDQRNHWQPERPPYSSCPIVGRALRMATRRQHLTLRHSCSLFLTRSRGFEGAFEDKNAGSNHSWSLLGS